ncbi:hypothetical protein ODR06_26230, partial [Escherichia coli]|nr:hypothetical protein [Escherichia coli]
MRKYIPLVLFIFSWPVLSADVHGQIYAPDRMNVSKRLVRTVLIFTESSDQLSRATDRVPGLPASPGYV